MSEKQSELWAWDRKQVPDRDWSHDFQTPAEVCDYMASLVPAKAKTILEPTPGDGGLISGILRVDPGFDITAPKDFFTLDASLQFDCVVMNPPFSSRYANLQNAPLQLQKSGMRVGYEILKSCMKKSTHVIALMPWFTISDSDLRLRYLRDFGLVSLTALPRKTFSYARIQTVIIQLKEGYRGETTFKIFDFYKAPLPSLFKIPAVE